MKKSSKTVSLGICICAWICASLAACAPGIDATRHELPLPATFAVGEASSASTSPGESAAGLDWAAYFGDAELAALLRQAVAGNLDLQLALQRVELARAGVHAASGERLPRLELFAGASLTRTSRYTTDGAGNASTEIAPGRLTPNPLGDLSLGIQASWEVDLSGKLGKLRGAARSQYLASVEGAHLVITKLVAEVAGAYYELLALDHSRDVLRETLAQQAQALDMVRAQKAAGRTNELAVQQFEAQLASTRALDAQLVQETAELESRLNLLLGRLPQPLRRDKAQLQVPVASTIAAGVPSELLRNRPDIREAELMVQASRLELEAARAAFYPSLQLTADLGTRAFHPKYLLTIPESIVGSIAGGLLAPLLNRRGLEASFSTAAASQRQAMLAYQQIVLGGFAEVATGLSALRQADEIVKHRRQHSAAVAGTVEAADLLFRAGKASYLEVLVAQQGTLEAELELVRALRDQHLVAVQLYRALGGGWRGELGQVARLDGE